MFELETLEKICAIDNNAYQWNGQTTCLTPLISALVIFSQVEMEWKVKQFLSPSPLPPLTLRASREDATMTPPSTESIPAATPLSPRHHDAPAAYALTLPTPPSARSAVLWCRH